MNQRFHRAQILLEPRQYQALAELARRESRSISAVVREVLRRHLQEQDAVAQRRRELQALDALQTVREEAARCYGVYQGDLLAEARAEREAQMDAAQTDER